LITRTLVYMTKPTITTEKLIDQKPHDLRNISRIEIPYKNGHGATIGWQVRFGKEISKFYSDKKYGGKEKALEEAKRFRNACELELINQPQGKYYYRLTSINTLTRKNKSGIPGVSRHNSKRPGQSPAWRSQWPTVSGKHVGKSFSISKYGEEKAKQLAQETYQAGVDLYLKSKIHPLFLPSKSLVASIWRYMDFTKFVSMLDNEGLYFTRIDKMEDVFEGSFSKGNEKLRSVINIGSRARDVETGTVIKKLRKWVYVNCWHQNKSESAAMWKLYSKSNESVCIRSTYDKLRSCLDDTINVGCVRYVDYEKDWVPESHPLAPFLYKRLSFEHEKEIRALISTVDLKHIDKIIDAPDPEEEGIWTPVNLNELIDAIYVAPESAEWFRELVENVAHTYGLKKQIIKSALENEPFY